MAGTSVSNPETGELYVLTSHLGGGAFGEVYRAFSVQTRIDYAIKVIPCPHSVDAVSCINEFALQKAVRHPFILQVEELFFLNRNAYLVLEYCPGKTLRKRILAQDYSDRDVLKWSFQLFAGLQALHQQAVIHRDIKPDNLLLSEDDDLKIGDLGIATVAMKVNPVTFTTKFHVTRAGTLPFMPPEMHQFVGYTPSADTYAAAIVVIAMVTRQPQPMCFGRVPIALSSASQIQSEFFNDRRWMRYPVQFQTLIRRALGPAAIRPRSSEFMSCLR